MAERKVSLPISNKKVEDLLMWRDVKASGIAFGGITLAYFILEWSGYTLISLAAYALLALLGGSLTWTYAAGFLNKPGPPIPSFVKEGFTDEEIRKITDQVGPIINKGLAVAYSIISGSDLLMAAKVGAVLYLIAKVAGWFSLFTFAYLVAACAFGLPKIYEMKKDEIDALAAKLMDQVKSITSKGGDMIKKIPSAKIAKKAE